MFLYCVNGFQIFTLGLEKSHLFVVVLHALWLLQKVLYLATLTRSSYPFGLL